MLALDCLTLQNAMNSFLSLSSGVHCILELLLTAMMARLCGHVCLIVCISCNSVRLEMDGYV